MNDLLIHNVEMKLKKEAEKVNGKKEVAIKDEVIKALISFSRQESEFAQAIIESDKSFSKCLEAVVKDSGDCLSDIEAYRRSVEFYFAGADIQFNMTINLCASVENKNKSVSLNVSLEDLF